MNRSGRSGIAFPVTRRSVQMPVCSASRGSAPDVSATLSCQGPTMSTPVTKISLLAGSRLNVPAHRSEWPRTEQSLNHAEERPLRLPPPESGIALIGVGIVGVVLLDPFDIFFIVAGALTFSPRLFQRTERWVQARLPGIHKAGRRHIDRFLDNFERRYPPDRD